MKQKVGVQKAEEEKAGKLNQCVIQAGELVEKEIEKQKKVKSFILYFSTERQKTSGLE